MKAVLACLCLASLALTARGATSSEDSQIWYAQPAARWLEALPVGNGRLGAMIFGGPHQEHLALNESTIWSGAPSDQDDNPQALPNLARIRALFFEGKYIEARDLCAKDLLGREGNYGSHLPMGDLYLDLAGAAPSTGYRRWLDLEQGMAVVEYSADGVRYRRELIASHPDQALVLRLTSSRARQLSFSVRLGGGDLPSQAHCLDPRTLVLSGQALEKKHSNGKTGVQFECWVQVLNSGGSVTAKGDRLEVSQADSVTLLVTANSNFGGQEPGRLCREQLQRAAEHSYARLRKRHLADYQPLFRRVSLDLGGGDRAKLPTDLRLAALHRGQNDPQLEALFFQYGRYLLIAGSREDSPLPTNLQGIWNDNLACNMGWTCDFHLDINTEQNYWPAEVCNLAECHEPLFRLLESLRVAGRRTARTMYGARGWVCHVFTNPWGFTSPGWGLGWGLHPTGGIWLASDLWEHYRFTGDRVFLQQRAYPVLKEAAEFFLDYLVEHPKYGWLVTGPADSPENAFLTPDGKACSESMGPTCDAVLVRDLFSSCRQASEVLGCDEAFRVKLAAAQAKLPPLRVGRHGQLMEWLEDFEEAAPNHRHTSHLIALYPSAQISPTRTPELARAARTTIERRLSQRDWEDVEWSRGNLINFFARLGDGEQAHRHLLGLLHEDTETNLLTFSRGGIAGAPANIFCIDGNYAGTAGIAEMLLQSQSDEIVLLPALPKAWPTGRVSGLRARGGFTVDIAWRNGELLTAVITSKQSGPCRVRYRSQVSECQLAPGHRCRFDPSAGH